MNKMTVYDNILDVAATLIQTKGYNAFSFRDIAKIIGIKTSSIHYHFPTKADLGKAVVSCHIIAFQQKIGQLLDDHSISCQKKIGLLLDILFATAHSIDKKMCLGGMLAYDALTLPEPIRLEVQSFFKQVEKGLEELLLQGKAKGEFHFRGSTKLEAEFIVSLVQGSLLLAKLFHDEDKLFVARNQIETRLWQ